MGDRVAVMSEGRIEQIDTPQIVYRSPANEFVARFLGRVNVFSTELGDTCGPLIRETQVEVMVRPEDISMRPLNGDGPLGNGQIPGKVASYTFLGRTVLVSEVQLRERKLRHRGCAQAKDSHEHLRARYSGGSHHGFLSSVSSKRTCSES